MDKVDALAMFVCAIIVAGASILALTIRGFDVSAAKQRAINARLAELRAGR
jgi:hypothetical protein